MVTAVEFKNVSIVFGDKPEKALPEMDKLKERSEIRDLTGQILGVHNCSLTVEEGEIVVLMGLSGSGKSTLLRGVNGLNSTVRGDVLVRHGDAMVNVSNTDKATLRSIRQTSVAMVFQQFGLLPWRTVRENVRLGLELSGTPDKETEKRVNAQLELVGLAEWSELKVSELSGGMQQRVGLARAFVTEAPILLMDEPFSALDPLIRNHLQNELLELQRKLKRTIIFVSHDLDEAFKLGDKIAILEGGRLVQSGTPKEIYTKPANEYVTEFVNHMNPLGVLTADDIMDPVSNIEERQGVEVSFDMTVKEVMSQLLEEDTTLEVVKNGAVIGRITNASLVKSLALRC